MPRDRYVRVDANDYSVHPSVVGRRIDIYADAERVWVSCDGRSVAGHDRCWAQHQSRGGDRQANSALYTIVLSRLRWDPRTRNYVNLRVTEGKTRREAIRCLRCHVAREVYQVIGRTTPQPSTT